MSKALRYLAVGLVVLSIAGPYRLGPLKTVTPPPEESPRLVEMTPSVKRAVTEAQQRGNADVEMEFLVGGLKDIGPLKAAVIAHGGKVISQEETILRVQLPPAAAESVVQATHVVAMETNQHISVESSQVNTQDKPLPQESIAALSNISMDAVGANAFRKQHAAEGRGIVVAVIDTGLDASHPDLRTTSDGKAKLVDWKDFTGEGRVAITTTVPWAPTFTVPNGRVYKLPDRPASSQTARFGLWDEYRTAATYWDRDLDRNGFQGDQFGVLFVDAHATGVYDTVYVDTNDDGSFQDEQPLETFNRAQSYGLLGRVREGPLSLRRLPFVVADLDPTGEWISLGFDAHGHGTQVGGVLGAYNPAGGYTGVAPGVQIMALKAISSTGEGDWWNIWQAIKYAATHGANVINVSIGNLASATSSNSASERLNQLARQYGVLIVLAADNTGPGLSSGATLGSASTVMAVGAYYSPAMWQRDRGYVVPHEGIWWQSGMGPRTDGSSVPNLIAPGGSPTTSPTWRHSTGYTTEVGTSISTPFVSGSAALLMEAGRQQGLSHDRQSIKQALEMGARSLIGFDRFEQGNGLLSLETAYSHLKLLTPGATLSAVTQEGGEGILARSYLPGSNAFWLANAGTNVSRVNIFNSDAWVHSDLASLTIPPGTQRRLGLQFDPPAEVGVHSAYLQVTQPDHYGVGLTIPITYVRPIVLTDANDHTYQVSSRLEIARYKRYFFMIQPGTDAFDVTTRVLPDSSGAPEGTLIVNIYRPDGQAVHRLEIGRDGTGLSSLFHTDQPVNGVWEVVVTAKPDTTGTLLEAAYSLEAVATTGAFAEQPVKLVAAPGSAVSVPLKFTAPRGGLTGHIEVVGLSRIDQVDPWNVGVPWRVEHRQQSVLEDFTLQAPVQRMRIETSNPIPVVDLQLYLYYYDPNLGWQPRAQLTDPTKKYLELTDLPAGRYQVLSAVANGLAPPGLQFQYRRLLGSQVYPVQAIDPITRHEFGDSWTAPITFTAPTTPGRYIGQVLLRDTIHQETLDWYPIEISVGQPELVVQPLVAQLRPGKSSDVVLELREVSTKRLVDAAVTVNGQRFITNGGRLTIPVKATAATQVLEIEADLAAYQYLKHRITLPVRADWGIYPMGNDTSQELSEWRRKVLAEWP